MDLSVCIW